jgi:xanthine/CO dehydrogenase XdhC/CoxF family maturation factor
VEAEALDRLYAPIGLDVGAEGPDEIAAAVVAEVLAVFAGRSSGHLRDRPGPIHQREAACRAEALS